MESWMMAHPILFTALVAFALLTVWGVVTNVCDLVKAKMAKGSVEKWMERQGKDGDVC